MTAILQGESAAELVSATGLSFFSFASTSLALGLTYCWTANLTTSPEKRRRLVTLAREALTTATKYMKLAPLETHADMWDAAKHLHSEIVQLDTHP